MSFVGVRGAAGRFHEVDDFVASGLAMSTEMAQGGQHDLNLPRARAKLSSPPPLKKSRCSAVPFAAADFNRPGVAAVDLDRRAAHDSERAALWSDATRVAGDNTRRVEAGTASAQALASLAEVALDTDTRSSPNKLSISILSLSGEHCLRAHQPQYFSSRAPLRSAARSDVCETLASGGRSRVVNLFREESPTPRL